MRIPRRHLSRKQSEDLLTGLPVRDDLSQLLSDARSFGPPRELPGEAAALAAFRSWADVETTPEDRSLPVRMFMFNRALAAKVVLAATATVAVGGVAVAATTGNLPGNSQIALTHPNSSSSPSGTHKATPVGPSRSDDDRDGPGRLGHPELRGIPGLCVIWAFHKAHPSTPWTARPSFSGTWAPRPTHAWPSAKAMPSGTVGSGKTPGQGSDKKDRHPEFRFGKAPSFDPLIKAAGGADKVDAFCANLLKNLPKPTGPHIPDATRIPGTHPGHPGASATGKPGNPGQHRGVPQIRPTSSVAPGRTFTGGPVTQ